MFEKQKNALKDDRNFGFLLAVIGLPIIAILCVLLPALLAR